MADPGASCTPWIPSTFQSQSSLGHMTDPCGALQADLATCGLWTLTTPKVSWLRDITFACGELQADPPVVVLGR